MASDAFELLASEVVRGALSAAWRESLPGSASAHEEGGFILRDGDGDYRVSRWAPGENRRIEVPPHPDCRAEGCEIWASFHTHPNTNDEYLQAPSATDRRAVRMDPDLKGPNYVGEFVVSQAIIYLVTPAGRVVELGDTTTLLEI